MFPGLREIVQGKLSVRPSEEFRAKVCHGHGCPAKLTTVCQRAYRVRSATQEIPVEQEPKAVIGVSADRPRVFSARAVGGLGCRTVNFDVDVGGIARPP